MTDTVSTVSGSRQETSVVGRTKWRRKYWRTVQGGKPWFDLLLLCFIFTSVLHRRYVEYMPMPEFKCWWSTRPL